MPITLISSSLLSADDRGGRVRGKVSLRLIVTNNYPSKLIFNYKYLFLICTAKRLETDSANGEGRKEK